MTITKHGICNHLNTEDAGTDTDGSQVSRCLNCGDTWNEGVDQCAVPGDNHSEDLITVFQGSPQAVVLCGYHESQK